MPAFDSIHHVMRRLRKGDQQAATEVFHRFSARIALLAKRWVQPPVTRRFDPEDVVQSVYGSFFRRYRAGEYDVHDWNSLWGLLAIITRRKCQNRVAYQKAGCRDVRRDESLFPNHDTCPNVALTRGSSADEAAIATEILELLLDGLSPRDQGITALHMEKHTVTEIACQLDCSQRTVARVIERARKKLRRVYYHDLSARQLPVRADREESSGA